MCVRRRSTLGADAGCCANTALNTNATTSEIFMDLRNMNASQFICGLAGAQCGKALPFRELLINYFGEAAPRRCGRDARGPSIYSTQSAMKMFVSPRTFPLRFEAKTSFFPSGENIGKPSNVSL